MRDDDTKPSRVVDRRSLPAIDAPTTMTPCDDCGEPVQIVAPVYCGACDDRRQTERVMESGNDYRREAMLWLEREMVKSRVRAHQNGGK